MKILPEQFFGLAVVPLVAVSIDYEYVNRIRGAQIGIVYTVLNPAKKCKQYRVKVPSVTSILEQSVLDEHNLQLKFVMVSFEGFDAEPYSPKNGGPVDWSCKAEKITLVTNK